MKLYPILIGFAIFLSACNTGTETGNIETDSTSQTSGRGSDSLAADTATTGVSQNHMKTMHDAVANMMNRMKSMTASGNVDRDFAMMMKHHHQGGVDMGKAEIEGGKDDSMKVMAQRIVDQQEKDIENLDIFLQANQQTGSSDFSKKAIGNFTEMSDMKMESGSLDAMFASMMIPHHRDAAKISREYLKLGKNEELRKLAQKIVDSHPKEIRQLEQWLDKNK